jgi:signal transduction histidine kinase
MRSILGWSLLVLGALAGAVFVGGEFVPVHHQALEPYLSNLPIIPAYAIAAFLYWRRPKHRVSHRLLGLGASPVIALGLGEVLSVLWQTQGPEPWYWLLAVAQQVAELSGVAAGVALVAVFPDGLYQRRYERWIVIAVTAQVVVLPLLLLLCAPTLQYDPFMVWANPLIRSPLYTPALSGLQVAATTYYDSVFVWALVAVGVLALRYRRLAYELKQQVKWPLWAAICFAGSVVVGSLHQAGIVPNWFSQGVWYLTLPLFPFTIAIAMLRYRLLDIDVVIRKSLVYGVLWLAILGGYLGLAWALGLAAQQRLPIAVAILLTIAITIAFQPARRWLEGLADRWVFGERLTGYQALRQLGAALETTMDADALGPHLASAIRKALGLRWVKVSTRRSAGAQVTLQAIGWDGIGRDEAARADAVVPLEHAGEVVGVIECGPKREGVLDARDRELLGALARQVALGLRNVRLAADLTDQLELVRVQAHELAASRARIVQAQDAERRRIQRDLHDGVQQHLVTLAAKLRRAAVTKDADFTDTVEGLAGQAEDAVFALQDFSNGIYPSVLSDEGLPAALWTHAQRLPVTVELDIAPDVVGHRFSRDGEAALYFVALEAIVNAQKHGAAQQIHVSVRRQGDDLLLEVTDQGRGMPSNGDGRAGLGLSNMKDRVAALGGKFEISSRPGQGARVTASVPQGTEVRAPEVTPADRSALPTHAD